MHVQAILQTKGTRVVSTRADETIAATARLLAHHNIGAVVVLNDAEQVVGIISERDLVRGLAANGPAVAAQTVAEHMTRSVLSCQTIDTIQDIMAVMTARRVRHLPVLEDGYLTERVLRQIGRCLPRPLQDIDLLELVGDALLLEGETRRARIGAVGGAVEDGRGHGRVSPLMAGNDADTGWID